MNGNGNRPGHTNLMGFLDRGKVHCGQVGMVALRAGTTCTVHIIAILLPYEKSRCNEVSIFPTEVSAEDFQGVEFGISVRLPPVSAKDVEIADARPRS